MVSLSRISECRSGRSSANRPYALWLPARFDPRDHLPRALWPYADDARYLVSTIVCKAAFGDMDPWEYVHLNSRVLRRVMTQRKIAPITNALKQAGVIETIPYRVNQLSRGYRLTAHWQARNHCRVLATDLHLLQRIWVEQARLDAERALRWKPIHYQLDHCQRGLSVTDAAKPVLASLEGPALLCQDILVRRIRDRDFHFSVSSTERCFNAITGLKKSLRPTLLLNEEPLGNIDISCAQPGLLALLIGTTSRTIRWEERTTYMTPSSLEPLLVAVPSLASAARVSIDLAEFEEYRHLVTGGRLYDRLMEGVPGVSRDDLKLAFIRDVLAKGGRYPSDVENWFCSAFPGIYAYIRAVNSRSHAALIRALQEAEAWLVIDRVAPKLVASVPILTLHDAIYVAHSALDMVEAAFRETFDEIGFSLALKREPQVGLLLPNTGAAKRDDCIGGLAA